eukprot:jgi/Botrbrau1/20315/Bobra.0560s0001.1
MAGPVICNPIQQMRASSLRRVASLTCLGDDTAGCSSGTRARKKRIARTVAKANEIDNVYEPSSGRPYIAGVPLARPATKTGERLLKRLVDRPHIFVQGIQEELAFISGDAERPSSVDWTDRGVGGSAQPSGDGTAAVRFTPPIQPSSGYAAQPYQQKHAIHVFVNDFAAPSLEEESQRRFNALRQGIDGWSQYEKCAPHSQLDMSYSIDDDNDDDGVPGELQTLMPSGDELADWQREGKKDVMYCWAIAEAYLRHPIMHTAMKALLNRHPQQLLLPVGLDGMSLDSSVTLLDYNQQGKYLVGGVKFESVHLEPTALNAVWRSQGQQATDKVFQLTSMNPTLPVDPLIRELFGVEYVSDDQVLVLNRDLFSDKYLELVGLGYHERRVATKLAFGDEDLLPLHKGVFDYVPESNMASYEADHIAKRHANALFGLGDQPTITEWRRLRHMVYEARYFGRALQDAEQYVLQDYGDAPTWLEASYGPNFNSLGSRST